MGKLGTSRSPKAFSLQRTFKETDRSARDDAARRMETGKRGQSGFPLSLQIVGKKLLLLCSKNRFQENITRPEPEDPVPILGKVQSPTIGKSGQALTLSNSWDGFLIPNI